MVQAPAAHCVNHRRRDKVAGCSTCGNALCADCIVHTSVGVKCRSCTGARAAGVFQASDTAPRATVRADAKEGARRRPWAAALVAGGVVVIGVAAFALLSRHSSSTPTAADRAQVDAGPTKDFTERQTQFAGANGQNMGGTLTLPGDGVGRNIPGVLIVPGLGAIDRNSATAATTIDATRDALVSSVTGIGVSGGDPLYKDLAEALAKAGVASFRYEKRGTTASPLKPGQKLSFDDEIGDARAALDVLAQRQEIGTAPLAVLGHDEGSVVAMRLASSNPRVKAVVAVSMPARSYLDVVADELTRGRGAEMADQWRSAATTLTTTGKAPPADSLPELLRPIFAPGQDAYLSSVLTYNPGADAAKLSVPLLLVRGGGDKAVTAADFDRLSNFMPKVPDVLVGDAQADHNLSLAGSAGHEHSNTVTGPVDYRDANVRVALADWVKGHVTA